MEKNYHLYAYSKKNSSFEPKLLFYLRLVSPKLASLKPTTIVHFLPFCMKQALLFAALVAASLSACDSGSPETASKSTENSTITMAPTEDAATEASPTAATAQVDGAALYAANCQACHQATGMGLPGAFPALNGSSIVNNKDATQLITIVLKGYDARPEYGVMPGYAGSMTDEQVAAVATQVRSSWENKAPAVTTDLVSKVRATTK